MLRRVILLVLLGLALLLPCGASAKETLMSRHTDAYFSTVSALFLYADSEQAEEFSSVWQGVKNLLSEIEQAVSLSVLDSDIARFNALPCGASLRISDITADILTIAFHAHEQTGGLYDPTVYPLVDLWGFSPRFNRNAYSPSLPYDRAYQDGALPPPSASHVEALLPLVGLDGIALSCDGDAWLLQKNTPSVEIDGEIIHAQLDLGGLAKGYACDRIRSFLLDQGFTRGHFVCGDSSMAILSRPTEDGLYTLTLGKPRKGASADSHYASLRVRDTTLSTSSDATHFRTYGGVRCSHIIDPRTGFPACMPNETGLQRGMASVTLLGGSAALGDALSTALCLMTPEEAADYFNTHLRDMLAVCVLWRTGSDTLEVMTNAPDVLTLTDPAYLPAYSIQADGTLRYTGAFFSP